MTLEQALRFEIAGKQLREMSSDDWRQWLERLRAERAMLVAMREIDISDEEDRHFHAKADRLDDLICALKVIFS